MDNQKKGTFQAIGIAALATFIGSFALVEDFHLMISPAGWEELSQKVDSQKEMRDYSKELVITPLSQQELSELCNCDITLVEQFLSKGALLSSPMSKYDLEITSTLHDLSVCGIVNASMVNTANRGVYYKWHGLPFTSSDCERARTVLAVK